MNSQIGRQTILDAIDANVGILYDSPTLVQSLKSLVWSLPSEQPETAKRIVGKSRDGMTLWYQCDMCNEPVDAQDDFCRGCGRRLIDE